MRDKSPPGAAGERLCSHCQAALSDQEHEALRCECGNLIARYVPEGLELKCRRCKRIVIVPLPSEAGRARAG